MRIIRSSWQTPYLNSSLYLSIKDNPTTSYIEYNDIDNPTTSDIEGNDIDNPTTITESYHHHHHHHNVFLFMYSNL